MKITIQLLIITFLLPNICFSQSLFGKIFGATTYDECILLKIESNTTAYAAKLIQNSCRKKFPKEKKKSRKNKANQLLSIPSQVVEEKFKKLLLHHNSTKESADSVYITFINKSKNWRVNSVTITFVFNEDGDNEEIKLYGTPNYPINYQQKGKIDLYPNLRFGIRKNFKSWWLVGFMGKKSSNP